MEGSKLASHIPGILFSACMLTLLMPWAEARSLGGSEWVPGIALVLPFGEVGNAAGLLMGALLLSATVLSFSRNLEAYIMAGVLGILAMALIWAHAALVMGANVEANLPADIQPRGGMFAALLLSVSVWFMVFVRAPKDAEPGVPLFGRAER